MSSLFASHAAEHPWNVVGRRTWIAGFIRHAKEPDTLAARDEKGRMMTRGELLGLAAAAASRVQLEYGIKDGARVGVHLENTLENMVLVVGLTGMGAVVAPISTKLTTSEVIAQVRVSGLDLVVSEQVGSGMFVGCSLDVPMLDVRDVVDLAGPHCSASDHDAFVESALTRDVDAPAVIICTSGSSAAPKPIVLSHGNVMFAVISCQSYYALSPVDTLLTFFPWCHSNGHINQLVTSLALGVRLVVADRFTARGFARQLVTYDPTVVFMNSTHMKLVLSNIQGDEPVKSSLRIVPTALDMDADQVLRFNRIFPSLLRKVYYQTELCAPVTVCDLLPVRHEVNSNPLGYAALSHEIRLLDESGNDVEPGAPGEILVRSLVQYGLALGRIDADTGELVRYPQGGEWWQTGDLAVAVDDGFLYYVGRTSDMVKRAGHNVALPEVVAALLSHPEVSAAAVIGVPDPVREEQIVAFVVGDVSADAVFAHCAQRLASYKVPSLVLPVAEIPTTDIGKVDKAELRRLWSKETSPS